MKLIISVNVLKEADQLNRTLVNLIAPHVGCPVPTEMQGVDEQVSEAIYATVGLKNVGVSYFAPADEVTYEINDKIVIAILKLYGRVAGAVDTLINIAKPLFGSFKNDIEAITALAEERN